MLRLPVRRGLDWLEKGSWIQYLSFVFFLFGTKLSIIHFFGNATPYWDQWDAEWAGLYEPFLTGVLQWRDFLTLQNEHRLVLTRVLSLVELVVNGTWNPLLQMTVNALLHVVTIAYLVRKLNQCIGGKFLGSQLLFGAVLFGVPYAWENTLAGLQSVFYFVILLSLASLWFVSLNKTFSLSWWSGLALGILAFLSLASGVFAFLSAALVSLVIFIKGKGKDQRLLIGAAVLLILSVAGVLITPTLAHHASLRASSLGEFWDAMISILSWPGEMGYLAALVRNSPGLVFVILTLREFPQAADKKWFLVSLFVWSLGTAASVAYGRAAGPTSSRYLDLFAISILINFACLLSIARTNFFARWGRLRTTLGMALWVLLIFVALGFRSEKLPRELTDKRKISYLQETNLRRYLTSGAEGDLRNAPFHQIPYPDGNRLISLLTSPQLRQILPNHLLPNSGSSWVTLGPEALVVGRPTGGRLDNLVNAILEQYWIFLGLGFVFFMWSLYEKRDAEDLC